MTAGGRRTELSVRTVQRAVKALTAADLVKVVRVGRLNAGPPLATLVSPVLVRTRAVGLAAATTPLGRAPNDPELGRGRRRANPQMDAAASAADT